MKVSNLFQVSRVEFDDWSVIADSLQSDRVGVGIKLEEEIAYEDDPAAGDTPIELWVLNRRLALRAVPDMP